MKGTVETASPVAPVNPANAIAERMTGRDYISFSQVRTYQSCPLKWWFQYVADVPREQTSAGLVFGKAIHAALERYWQNVLTGESAPNVDALMETYQTAWCDEFSAPIHYGKTESRDSLRDLARRMLEAYLSSEAAKPVGTILGVEEELRGPQIRGLPDLLARLDLITLTDDALVVTDFKTARNRWNETDLQNSSPQLVLYGEQAAGLAAEYGDVPIRLEFVVLTKTKNPVIERHVVETDIDALARTRQTCRAIWAHMQAGPVYPNPSPMNCTGCPFQQACRQWCG